MYLSNCFVRLDEACSYNTADYMQHAGIIDSFEGVSITYLPIGNIILKKLIALIDNVYSFTTDESYIDEYYEKFTDCYRNICNTLDLDYYLSTYISDDILGFDSQEFLAVIEGAKDPFRVIDESKRLVKKCDDDDADSDGIQRGLEIAHVYKCYEIFSSLIPPEKLNGNRVFMNGLNQ